MLTISIMHYDKLMFLNISIYILALVLLLSFKLLYLKYKINSEQNKRISDFVPHVY